MNQVETIILLFVGISLFILIPAIGVYCCRCNSYNRVENGYINIHTVRVQNEYSKLLDHN